MKGMEMEMETGMEMEIGMVNGEWCRGKYERIAMVEFCIQYKTSLEKTMFVNG